MDKFLNFFKEFMPLLEHYPAWAKYLFGITLLLVFSSLFLLIILYPSVSSKKKTEQTAAAINSCGFFIRRHSSQGLWRFPEL